MVPSEFLIQPVLVGGVRTGVSDGALSDIDAVKLGTTLWGWVSWNKGEWTGSFHIKVDQLLQTSGMSCMTSSRSGGTERKQNTCLFCISIYFVSPDETGIQEQWDAVLALQELSYIFWLRRWQPCPHREGASPVRRGQGPRAAVPTFILNTGKDVMEEVIWVGEVWVEGIVRGKVGGWAPGLLTLRWHVWLLFVTN